jgi:hypothetical protein
MLREETQLKKGFTIGIIALFVINVISPMVIGYTSDVLDRIEIINSFDDSIKTTNSHMGNWSRVVIDSNLGGSHNIIVENVDNDYKSDLVVDAYADEVVVWYKQPSDPLNDYWTKYIIDPDFPNAHDIQIGDIDGDGLRDVVGIRKWFCHMV